VQVSWRRELEQVLSRFVASHRGLRLGRLFGVPAAYAGGRLFACATADGIAARLPSSALDAARAGGGAPWTPRGRRRRDWVVFRPGTARAADAIGPFLEIAARHVALEAGRARS
jgi:hypothetical protein